MAGLIPLGDGGGVPGPTCDRCGAPALGPCAFCRGLLCAGEECAAVLRERGLPDVVVCVACARARPVLAASAWTAPVLGAVAVAAALVAALTWGRPWPSAAVLAGAILVGLLAAATALARWQWRSRLGRARGVRPRRPSRPQSGSGSR